MTWIDWLTLAFSAILHGIAALIVDAVSYVHR